MDAFSTDGVCSCYNSFVILVIACNYLPTQGADLCKLCLYLLGYFLGFLLGVCDRGFLGLDEFFGSADIFFEFRQFFLQEVESVRVADTSALISRVAFFWLRALHFWVMSAFREA